jgi:crotonobetainyl-CoA:carnitine CoA-transferase CaiB-like acyl-CoA transferase
VIDTVGEAVRPLSGIHVLDVGRYIAGPLCGSILADLGADVVRLDNTAATDDRLIGSPDGVEDGSQFRLVNGNKRSLAMDLRDLDAQGAVREALVRWADVVITNATPGQVKRLGLDYESLRLVKPELIKVSITAFGWDGSSAERVGFDGLAQVFSGAAYLSGEDGVPSKSAITWVDHATGQSAAIGALAAILAKQRTGRGSEIKRSLVDVALSFTGQFLIDQALCGAPRNPIGNASHWTAPSGIFPTTDGAVMLQVSGARMFEAWAGVVDDPEATGRLSDTTDSQRASCREELNAIARLWCSRETTEAVIDKLSAAGVPVAPVLRPVDIPTHPWVLEAGLLAEVREADGRRYPIVARDLAGNRRSEHFRPGPRLGEHSKEVLAEIGIRPPMIDALITRGAVLSAPSAGM